MKRTRPLLLAAAFCTMLAIAPAHADASGSTYVKGYGSGTVVSTDFSFNQGSDGLFTVFGNDTLGGPDLGQGVSEFEPTDNWCTAPDNSIGELYYLYESLSVSTYVNGGQLYNYSDYGNECFSLTTTSYGGSIKFKTIGGSGRFSGASGYLTQYFSGNELAAPPSPGSGFFLTVQYSFTGTISQ
jgi:hypothetical protein